MKSAPTQFDVKQSQGEGRVQVTRSFTLQSAVHSSGAVAYVFLLPSLVFLAVFTLWPIVSVIWSSFRARQGREQVFVALQNYERLFTDPIIQQVLKNTLFYVTAGVGFAVIGGLLLALLLNQGLRNIGFFRFPFLATIALPMVSVASIWLFLYSPRVGLFNEILAGLGLPLSNWLNGRELALPALFVVYLWKQLGYFALFYLAALQALPVDVLEAAKLDGITLWQQLRFIIWPLVSPTTYFVSTISVLGALQQIDHVFVLTTGGPNNATNMSLFYVYEQGFKYFNIGTASAMTVILLAVLMTMAILQFVYLERRVHYD
ncbi:MAG: sugar ABC transporter permease [Chloroflexi bacterium]|nr:sugar ABC transporter permease [Chloroflexota bacterium]